MSRREDCNVNTFLRLARGVALAATVAVALALAVRAEWHTLSITDLFWKGIIPLVPLLLLLAPHVWRIICPVAALNLAGAKLGQGKQGNGRVRLPDGSFRWMKKYGAVAAAVLLWTLVPLRLVLFNRSAAATLVLVLAVVTAATVMGFLAPWKAGWCTSICPVYPVEKFYGSAPLWALQDPRCTPANSPENCYRCAVHCLDVSPDDPKYWIAMKNIPAARGVPQLQDFFLGSFPGFVLAYLLLNNFAGASRPASVVMVARDYGAFLLLMFASYGCYRIAQIVLSRQASGETHQLWQRRLNLIVIALAVNIYYLNGGVSLAGVVTKLGGWTAQQFAITLAIVATAFVTSAYWLHRAWDTTTPPSARW
jgi:nitrite reductase (NADH) large subunit